MDPYRAFSYDTVFGYAGAACHVACCRERRDGLLAPDEAVAGR